MKNSIQVITIIVLLSLLVLIPSCQKGSTPKSEAGLALVDSVVSADGVMIYYETTGSGSPTLVFVHGWCCDRSYWKNQVKYFANKVQVATLDLAGHGQSGLNREVWSMDAFGQDVAAVVNKLNLPQVILVGHSMGGPVIAEAAQHLQGKVLGLVGVDTYHDLTKTYTKDEVDETAVPLRENFQANMTDWVRKMFPESADSTLVAEIAEKAAAASPKAALGIFDWYPNLNMVETFKEINLPVTTINTDLWPMNETGNNEVVPNMEVIMMEGLGHYPMLEDPDVFNDHLYDVARGYVMGSSMSGGH